MLGPLRLPLELPGMLQPHRDPLRLFADFAVTPASYIVFKGGGKTYVKNGLTGAIEFSSADDASAIQYAISSAVSQGGGRVFIKAGRYVLSRQLWIYSTIGSPVPLIVEGEGGNAYVGRPATELRFQNLPLTNENSSTCVRVGYRYDDRGNEVSGWISYAVKIVLRDLAISCANTRYRGIVLEGVADTVVLERLLVSGGAYGVVIRGAEEATIFGSIRDCTITGGYRDVNDICGAALQLGDILYVNGSVIVIDNGVANLLVESTTLLSQGDPPRNRTPSSTDIFSLRPAAIRDVRSERVTVVNSHVHIGGWGWGYGLHRCGTQSSITQPFSKPSISGDWVIAGTNFEGGVPKDPSTGQVVNCDNVLILEESDVGRTSVYGCFFYCNGVVRMVGLWRRGRIAVERSSIYYPYGSVELSTWTQAKGYRQAVAGLGYLRNVESFLYSGVIVSAENYIYINDYCAIAFSPWDQPGSITSPAPLPTSMIPHYGNLVFYRLPAGTALDPGLNALSAHHAWFLADGSRNYKFRAWVVSNKEPIVFAGWRPTSTNAVIELVFHNPSSSAYTTQSDIVVAVLCDVEMP